MGRGRTLPLALGAPVAYRFVPMEASAQPTAACAEHPDRPAGGGVCARCGSFMCGGCVAPETSPPICQRCEVRLGSTRMLEHVRIFAVVLLLHGALIALAGLTAFVYGAGLFFSFEGLPDPEEAHIQLAESILVAGMLGEGVLHMVLGGLQAYAGWRLREYRSRGLAIAAVFLGLLTILGCYCLPTSLAVGVWGLIVLLNQDVVAYFARRASGTGHHEGTD